MAVLALPQEDVVLELEAGEFPFLRHEMLWQGDGFWVSWASGGLVLLLIANKMKNRKNVYSRF